MILHDLGISRKRPLGEKASQLGIIKPDQFAAEKNQTGSLGMGEGNSKLHSPAVPADSTLQGEEGACESQMLGSFLCLFHACISAALNSSGICQKPQKTEPTFLCIYFATFFIYPKDSFIFSFDLRDRILMAQKFLFKLRQLRFLRTRETIYIYYFL